MTVTSEAILGLSSMAIHFRESYRFKKVLFVLTVSRHFLIVVMRSQRMITLAHIARG